MVQYVMVTYIARRLYFGPSNQEDSDYGMVTIISSQMEGGL